MSKKLDLDIPDFINFLSYLEEAIKKEAEQKKLDAGYNGEHHDGGASAMLYEFKIYMMGLNKEIPEHWVKHLDEFTFKNKLDKDPEYRDEYAEYLRLQSKFKDVPKGVTHG